MLIASMTGLVFVALAAWLTMKFNVRRTINAVARAARYSVDRVPNKGTTPPAAEHRVVPIVPNERLVPPDGFIPRDRTALIAEAESRLSGHIAYERVQLRPGWLLFDPADVMGQPSIRIRLAGEAADRPEQEVWLYTVENIRQYERKHSSIAQCRRASLQARWNDRRAAFGERNTLAVANHVMVR